MLEDYTMEKKPPGRPVQAPGKGVGTDSKKGQDGSNGKLFPKTSRRRESNGASSSKYDPNRKPVPQKSKAIDKRPRPRGQYYASGKEDTKVMDVQEAEVGSVFVPGSKKQNLNHLLNFHYAPRDAASQWRSGGGQRWNSGSSRTTSAILALSTHRHKYNKEQFLQANCQFVVKADGDYSPYASNPDTLVDWDLVEQIRVQGPEVPSCPICLSPPVAAKMTRCGHVYCWPCILHYLALSDKTWRKCPICFEAVHKQDLKSVVALPRVACNIMGEIEMRLMCREKGSLIVTPVEDASVPAAASHNKPLLVGDESPASAYSKLLLATPLQVLSILDREKAELTVQLSEEVGSPEVCFTEQAIELLSERENQLIRKNLEMKQVVPLEDETSKAAASETIATSIQPKSEALVYASAFDNVTMPLGSSPSSLPSEGFVESGSDVGAPGSNEECNIRCRNESMSSEGLGSEEDGCWESNITAEDLEMTNQSRINSPLSPNSGMANKYYYFYQAADGQHIYLHSLNVRMLERGYGSLENCPRVLRGKVLEKEAGSMTLELRKRLRCFQHLPLACQFEVAEIQLQPPVVTKETLNFFRDQLESRRRRRQKRAREEQKWEKRAAQVEAQKWGRFPSARIRIDSHYQFPECGIGSSPETPAHPTFENLGNAEDEAVADIQSSSPMLTDALDGLTISGETSIQSHRPMPLADAGNELERESLGCWGSAPKGDSGAMSFAQMLREGKSRPSLAESNNAWGVKKKAEGKDAILLEVASKAESVAKRRPTTRRGAASDESDGEGGDNQAPAFNQSFGDAIALALQRKENISEAGNTQGKKKKKQKQKILFNTNMAFIGK
ncbi:RING finger protein 10 isoform X2 [Ischnura elegans]|uniref:RING finger protein 10 isoform X2 n=1 Tax=Ischnura elegans TaxID=197161 RepID=UPI001ED876AC|nr:RING finger protein 10 isoform X2 [Ischnura elegans]